MKYNIRDRFEYIIALVNEFAKRFGLSDKQAYNYIKFHKGVDFIEKITVSSILWISMKPSKALLLIAADREVNYDTLSWVKYFYQADRSQ